MKPRGQRFSNAAPRTIDGVVRSTPSISPNSCSTRVEPDCGVGSNDDNEIERSADRVAGLRFHRFTDLADDVGGAFGINRETHDGLQSVFRRIFSQFYRVTGDDLTTLKSRHAILNG